MNHDTLYQTIQSLGLTGTDQEVADALNAARTAPDASAPPVTWWSLAVDRGDRAVEVGRKKLQALIAAASSPEKEALQSLSERLEGRGVEAGETKTRARLASLLDGDRVLRDAILDEATSPVVSETVAALDVQKANLLGASNAADRLAIAAEERKAEDAAETIRTWDGTGTPPAIYGA